MEPKQDSYERLGIGIADGVGDGRQRRVVAHFLHTVDVVVAGVLPAPSGWTRTSTSSSLFRPTIYARTST